jgi:hypothetical protein
MREDRTYADSTRIAGGASREIFLRSGEDASCHPSRKRNLLKAVVFARIFFLF